MARIRKLVGPYATRIMEIRAKLLRVEDEARAMISESLCQRFPGRDPKDLAAEHADLISDSVERMLIIQRADLNKELEILLGLRRLDLREARRAARKKKAA